MDILESGSLCSLYGQLLDNPVLFLLISQQAKERLSSLKQHFGVTDRCIIVQTYENDFDRVNDVDVINVEIVENADGDKIPSFDLEYMQKIEAAVRKTKQHKYNNGKDITVCVILESQCDSAALEKVCQVIYSDMESAYFNHVFFDFYFIISEEFVSYTAFGRSTFNMLRDLAQAAKKEWVRYIFLLSEMTNDERLITSKTEQFQAVLDAVALTNCHSSAEVSSTEMRTRLFEEMKALDSKFLVLGRTKLFMGKPEIRKVIRYEMLKNVYNLSSESDDYAGPVSLQLDSILLDIQAAAEEMCSGTKQVGCYKSMSSDEASAYTNDEIIFRCFRDNSEKYLQFCLENLSHKFEELMKDSCRQLQNSLNDVLYQSESGIYSDNCGEEIFNSAIETIKQCREKNEKERSRCEEKLARWKIARKTGSARRTWHTNTEYQYKVLDEWASINFDLLVNTIYEQCIREIEHSVYKWLENIKEKCKYLLRCRGEACSIFNELLDDCNETERCVVQRYQQDLNEYFEKNPAIVQQCRREVNGLLREEANFEHLNKCIWLLTDWLYSLQLGSIDLHSSTNLHNDASQYLNFIYSLLTGLKDRACLYMRGNIPNVEPFICLMGNSQNPLVDFTKRMEEIQTFVYETEYSEYPSAFFFQNIPSIEEYPAYQIYYRKYGGG